MVVCFGSNTWHESSCVGDMITKCWRESSSGGDESMEDS